MRFKHLLSFALLTAIISTKVQAQCNIKETAKGDYAYNTNSFAAAIELYGKAVGKVKDKTLKACVNYQIAKCYLKLQDFKKAEATFKKLVKVQPDDPMFHYDHGLLLKGQGRYEEAIDEFNKYVEKNPSDPKGKEQVAACSTAIEWKNHPTCYIVENFKALNTKEWDFSPIIANKKGTQLIFSSNRVKSTGKDNPIWGFLSEDLYVTNKDKAGKWSTPMAIPILSTTFSEGAGVMDRKFSTIYFTRCYGDKKNGSGCQIYKSRRQGPDKWNEPEKIELFPDSCVTGHPALTPDGKYMVFSSNVEGGEGGMDLYIAAYDKRKKEYADPKNLGKNINTFFEEMYPFIREDGSLYFASNRPEGMGGLDIYQSEQKSDTEWEKPENMRSPVNSEGDDFGIIFEPGKEAGYLTSNRKGGRGYDDIYTFHIPPTKILLTGTVRDKDTKAVIPGATVEMKDAAGNVIKVTTDQTGFYKQEIPFGVSYDMTASKKDYYNDVHHANTKGMDPLKTCHDTTLVRDFELKSQIIELEFEIQFEFDKCTWFKEYNDTLEKIVVIMKDNPTLVAELGAHTDARGSSDYNEKLSQCRADSVVSFLVREGIDKKRLLAKGYGEDQPRKLQKDMKGADSGYMFKKDTELTEDYINSLKKAPDGGDKVFEDAHRLNRRVTVRKVSDDYKPPVDEKEKDDDGGN